MVAVLIDPACWRRTAACPPQLGEKDDRQPDPIRPCPNVSAHHTWRRTHTYTISPLIFRHPPTACTGPAQRQDRSSSLRCGRSVLTPVLTRRCLPGGRKPAKPLVYNVLTEPRPFRDDNLIETHSDVLIIGSPLIGGGPGLVECVPPQRNCGKACL